MNSSKSFRMAVGGLGAYSFVEEVERLVEASNTLWLSDREYLATKIDDIIKNKKRMMILYYFDELKLRSSCKINA